MVRLTDAPSATRKPSVGKDYDEVLPPFEFGRVQTQMARQVVTGKVRDAERERQYEEFKDRVGEIVNGTVKRVEYGNIIVDLGRGEGIMRRDQSIPREKFNIGDRIRCLHLRRPPRDQGPADHAVAAPTAASWPSCSPRKCRRSTTGSSRSAPWPATRVSRAKMAVLSNDSSIDPVGACVGMRGSRVQAVVAELQGEKIDIIQWSHGRGDLHRQRPGPGRSLQGGDGRGGRARRSGGAGRAAVAGHRPPRPERPPRLAS